MPVGNPRDICPLSITNNYCGMGRSLEVRRKSENLPVVGSTLIRDPILQKNRRMGALVFSRAGTQVRLSGLMLICQLWFGLG